MTTDLFPTIRSVLPIPPKKESFWACEKHGLASVHVMRGGGGAFLETRRWGWITTLHIGGVGASYVG